MFRLALPLVAAEIGWMTMGVVDTMFVGRVSAEAMGAVSLGTMVFYTPSAFSQAVCCWGSTRWFLRRSAQTIRRIAGTHSLTACG